MEAFLQSLLADSQGLAAYLTVFGILVACGLGVPLPEDISLILGGYLAYQGAADLTVMMIVGFLGILLGDSLIYLVGRRVGENPDSGWFGRIVTPEKRAVVARMFERHGRKVVMIARFMPGVRAVTYFTAGSVKMNYFQFIFWDGLAALVSAPLFVYLGFRFGDEMDALVRAVKEGQFAVLGLLVVALVGAWIYHRRRKAKGLAGIAEALAPERDAQGAEVGLAADLEAGPEPAPPAAEPLDLSAVPVAAPLVPDAALGVVAPPRPGPMVAARATDAAPIDVSESGALAAGESALRQ